MSRRRDLAPKRGTKCNHAIHALVLVLERMVDEIVDLGILLDLISFATGSLYDVLDRLQGRKSGSSLERACSLLLGGWQRACSPLLWDWQKLGMHRNGLISGMVMGPKPQAFLVHFYDIGRQPLPVPGMILQQSSSGLGRVRCTSSFLQTGQPDCGLAFPDLYLGHCQPSGRVCNQDPPDQVFAFL